MTQDPVITELEAVLLTDGPVDYDRLHRAICEVKPTALQMIDIYVRALKTHEELIDGMFARWKKTYWLAFVCGTVFGVGITHTIHLWWRFLP